MEAVGRHAGGTENCLTGKTDDRKTETRGCEREISKTKNISVAQDGVVIETHI